mgnify:CR=1 FL=1
MQASPVVGPETVPRDTTHPPTHPPLESLDIGRLDESPSRDTPWRDQCQGRNWRTRSYLQCPSPSPTPLPGVEGAGAGPDPSHSHRAWEGRGQDIRPGTSTNPPEGYELPGGIAGSVQVERERNSDTR